MRQSERGFTLVEIMIVVAIIALLAAIAIPNVLRGRTTANESAAVGNTRALVSSLEMFRSVNNAYPATGLFNQLYDTAAAAGAAPACTAATVPNPDFGPASFCRALVGGAADVVQGFTYTYAVAAGLTVGQQYDLLVVPTTVGGTGTRSFYTNENGIVFHCREVVAAAPTGTAANARVGTPAVGWVTIDVALPVANCT
jgi:prepilin-type N-terminal cleavage/methylation domain-containing protein